MKLCAKYAPICAPGISTSIVVGTSLSTQQSGDWRIAILWKKADPCLQMNSLKDFLGCLGYISSDFNRILCFCITYSCLHFQTAEQNEFCHSCQNSVLQWRNNSSWLANEVPDYSYGCGLFQSLLRCCVTSLSFIKYHH